MRIRRQTVEHPFGTLNAWMGATHFLTKTLKNVSTEMSLHVLAYNMKRVMNILGTPALLEAIRACPPAYTLTLSSFHSPRAILGYLRSLPLLNAIY